MNDKLKELKNEVFSNVYPYVKDAVSVPEKIIFSKRYTSSTIDGCTSESGAVFKNKDGLVTIYIAYGRYCVCLLKFKAYTLEPVLLVYNSTERKRSGGFKPIPTPITNVSDIRNYTDDMCVFLKYVLE